VRIQTIGATSSIRAVCRCQLARHRWIVIATQDTTDVYRILIIESGGTINRVGVSGAKASVGTIRIVTLPMVVVVIVVRATTEGVAAMESIVLKVAIMCLPTVGTTKVPTIVITTT